MDRERSKREQCDSLPAIVSIPALQVDAEIAPVGHASTHSTKPSGQREELIVGLPRNRAGVAAAAMSVTTGSSSARLTLNALGPHSFIVQKMVKLVHTSRGPAHAGSRCWWRQPAPESA
jgi:hypothetical protein